MASLGLDGCVWLVASVKSVVISPGAYPGGLAPQAHTQVGFYTHQATTHTPPAQEQISSPAAAGACVCGLTCTQMPWVLQQQAGGSSVVPAAAAIPWTGFNSPPAARSRRSCLCYATQTTPPDHWGPITCVCVTQCDHMQDHINQQHMASQAQTGPSPPLTWCPSEHQLLALQI